MPGIKDPERVRKLLQGTAKLEFWETYNFSEVYSYFDDANKRLKQEMSVEKSIADEGVGETPEGEVSKDVTIAAEENNEIAVLAPEIPGFRGAN